MASKTSYQPTYYDILDVEEDAEASEAYLRIAKTCHPDKHLDDPLAKESFQELQEAYETLSDPEERAGYDAKLQEIRNPPPPPRPQPCCSAYNAPFPAPVRVPARPQFAPPPPFHPLFNAPIIIPSDVIWMKARLSQRIHPHISKVPPSYWRPPPIPPPLQFRPSLPPREYVHRAMMDMEVHMARVRWMAEVRGRGCR